MAYIMKFLPRKIAIFYIIVNVFWECFFPYNRANIRCKLDVLLFVTIFLKAMIHYHIHDKSLNSAEKYNLPSYFLMFPFPGVRDNHSEANLLNYNYLFKKLYLFQEIKLVNNYLDGKRNYSSWLLAGFIKGLYLIHSKMLFLQYQNGRNGKKIHNSSGQTNNTLPFFKWKKVSFTDKSETYNSQLDDELYN